MRKSLFLRTEVWVTLLAFACFLPALGADFVYDDSLLITDNAYVHQLSQWKRAWSTHFWDVSGSAPSAEPLRYYRPLVTLSYLLNWVTVPRGAWLFHLTNVLVHALNTWLVLLVGRRWTQSTLLAGACALLFALHPTRAEAVTWISGRPDPLMTTFLLLMVQLGYLGRRRDRRLAAALGALGSFLLALFCKEPALAGPLLLCVDAVQGRAEDRRWHAFLVGLTSAAGAGYLLLRHSLLPIESPPLSWTPAHGLVTVAHYFERIAFPWPLTFFYQLEQVGPSGPMHSWVDITAGGLLLLGLARLVVHAARRDLSALVLLIASAAFVGPLLNLFETGSKFTTSDRFLYLPLWLLALGLCRLFGGPLTRSLRRRPVRLVGAGLLAACCGAITLRTFDFTSSSALWKRELALSPDNPVALRGHAGSRLAAGDRTGAIRDLERSLRNPSLRFHTLATPDHNVESYGRLIALRAQHLPDGASEALYHLAADAVDRLAARPRQGRPSVLPIDWPTNVPSVRWVALRGEEVLARHLVPLTTRLDLHDISVALLEAIPDQNLHLAPNPPLIALSEAREQRFVRAWQRVETMKRRLFVMPAVVTSEAIADVEMRLRSAEQMFAVASMTPGSEQHLARAKAFASLGAYGRAVKEVQSANRNHPEFVPLFVQLLVFARLESAALESANRALGPERARITVESIRSQLPSDLLALPSL